MYQLREGQVILLRLNKQNVEIALIIESSLAYLVNTFIISIKGESAMRSQKNELKAPLINSAVLEIQCESAKQQGFIARYNQVIVAYNKYAEQGEAKMQVMVGNEFIYKISEYLNKPLGILGIVLAIVLIPLVNLFFLACIYIYLFYLRRENKKHLRNINRVTDPFESFYFMPDYCEQMNKHYVLLKFQLSQIQGFTFNEQFREKLSKKLGQKRSFNSKEKIPILIYDQYFYDSFYLYKKQFYKTLVWAIVGLFLLAISISLYLAIFVFL